MFYPGYRFTPSSHFTDQLTPSSNIHYIPPLHFIPVHEWSDYDTNYSFVFFNGGRVVKEVEFKETLPLQSIM